MLFVLDRELKILGTASGKKKPLNGSILEQINGEFSCTLVVPWDATTQTQLKEFNHVGFYMGDQFQIFQIRSIVDTRTTLAEREIYCEHISYQLASYITEDRRVDNGTAKDIITRILSDTDWKPGEIASLGEKTYNAFYIETRKALLEIAELYGGELRYRVELNEDRTAIKAKYVDLVATRGENTGIRFSPNKNLNELTREIDTLEMRTRLIGRGYSPTTENGGQERKIQFTDVMWSVANGDPADKPRKQNWIANVEAEAKYGVIWGVYEDRSETQEELLQNTWNRLMEISSPTITYTASLAFIRKFMNGKQDLAVGDHFTVIDDELGLHINTRILEITRDWYNQDEGSVKMGQFYKTIGDSDELDNIKSELDNIRDTISDINQETPEISFPDVVPPVSIVTTKGLFASIQIDWTYERGVQYEYALYGSQTKGFNPDQANLLYRGKGSSYLHFMTPNQTWYYRVCAFNSHGSRNEYSAEVTGNSLRITDASNYMAEASIGDAQIGELRLDRGWVGQLKGHRIDARELTVTDGDGLETLNIDSFGRVKMNVTEFRLASNATSDVPTKTEVANDIKVSVDQVQDNLDSFQITVNTTFKDEIIEESEAKAIKQQLNQLENTRVEILRQYDTVYANADLKGTAKTNLLNAKSAFETAHTGLVSTINTVIADGKVTSSESLSVDSTFVTYKGFLGTLVERLQEALDSIAKQKVDNVEIGGTNLYRGTQDFDSKYWKIGGPNELEDFELDSTCKQATLTRNYLDLITDTSAQGFDFSDKTKTWTISAMFKGDTDGQTIGVTLNADKMGYQQQPIPNGSWVKLHWVHTGDGKSLTSFRFQNDGLVGALKVAKVKVELGNKPTDWNPHTEDLKSYTDTKITNLEIGTGNHINFSEDLFQSGFIGNDGETHTSDYYIRTKFLDISGLADGEYTVSFGDNYYFGLISRVSLFDPDKTQVSTSLRSMDSHVTFYKSSDVKYVRFNIWSQYYEGLRKSFYDEWVSKVYLVDKSTKPLMLVRGDKRADWQPSNYDLQNNIVESIDKSLVDIVGQNVAIMNTVNNILSDDILTESERADLKLMFYQMKAQYNAMISTIDSLASDYFTGYRSDLVTAYDILDGSMQEILTSTQTVVANANVVRDNMITYCDKYNDCTYAVAEYTKDRIIETNTELNLTKQRIEFVYKETESALGTTKEINKHMSFGDNWLELYGTVNGANSQFKAILSNTKLAFLDGGNEVAYISNKQLNIENAEIKQTLKVGNYTITKSAKGGVVFKPTN